MQPSEAALNEIREGFAATLVSRYVPATISGAERYSLFVFAKRVLYDIDSAPLTDPKDDRG